MKTPPVDGVATPAGRASSKCVSASQRQLHAFVAGDEAELLIEAPRIGARLVGGELHHLAAVTAAFLDRPFEHAPAEAAAAARRRDAHALDLAAPEADARQAGNEA